MRAINGSEPSVPILIAALDRRASGGRRTFPCKIRRPGLAQSQPAEHKRDRGKVRGASSIGLRPHQALDACPEDFAVCLMASALARSVPGAADADAEPSCDHPARSDTSATLSVRPKPPVGRRRHALLRALRPIDWSFLYLLVSLAAWPAKKTGMAQRGE